MNNHLQKTILQTIFERLEFIRLLPDKVLNLGGNESKTLLKTRYTQAKITSDLSSSEIVDMIFAPMIFKNFTTQSPLFHQRLKSEGLLLFTTFGPDTLKELRATGVDLPTFLDMHDIGDRLLQQGFRDPIMDREEFTLVYPAFSEILLALKQAGWITGEIAPECEKAYETFRDPDGLPVTVEVVYGLAWGHHSKTFKADKSGEVRIPISSIT